MSRARVARRIAAAAAYGGGGAGLLGVGLVGLLLTEAQIARHTLSVLHGVPPRADGLYGADFATGLLLRPAADGASGGGVPGASAAVAGATDDRGLDSGGLDDAGLDDAGSDAGGTGGGVGAVRIDSNRGGPQRGGAERDGRTPAPAPATGAELALSDAPLLLAVLGDSTAAGFGVTRGSETPGALLAAGIAAVAERPVRLEVVAVNGATSRDLDRQATLVLSADGPGRGRVPDLALIMIGANDVTRRLRPAESVRLLGDALRRLRAAGTQVVVGTCPDLGTIEPVRPPLRWLARRASRQLAAAQTIAVVEAGASSVSLGDLLGPEFRGRPEMFAADRYHPSAQGYATAAMALLPTMCASLGLWPEVRDFDRAAGEGVLPVSVAAVEAAARGGTEVSGAAVLGAESGPRGRWAQLLLRHRRAIAERTPAHAKG